MRHLFLGVCVLALCIHRPAPAQEGANTSSAYVPVSRFDPSRDAAADIDAACAEARLTGRRVLLDVGGDWCIWCRRLDSLIAGQEGIREFLDSHYVEVKINYSRENRNEKVLSRYPKIKGYPHLFVLDSDGSLLHSQDTGELEKGKGHDPEKVMAFLKAWAP